MNNPPKKILIVTGIFPPDIGGPASFLFALAHYLARKNWQVTVLTLSDDPSFQQNLPFEVIRLKRSEFLPIRMLRFSQTVRKLAQKADLVFCNTIYFESIVRLPKTKPLVCKVVGDQIYDRYILKTGLQDTTLEEFQKKSISGFNRWDQKLRSWALNRAKTIVTPSLFFKKITATLSKNHKNILVIPNACQPIITTSAAKIKNQLVMLCRLTPVKNVGLALNLLKQLPEDYTLKIIGDGPQKEELVSMTQNLDLAKRVQFLGRMSRQDATQILAESEIFLMLSSYENFPHTILEAFETGTLVIANAVGGIPEMIQDKTNGILLQKNTVEELKNEILNLTPEQKESLLKQAKISSKNYQPQTIFSRYEELFLEAI